MGEIEEARIKKATEMLKGSSELERKLSDSIKHIAKMRRASYEAHLAEGFTPAEALELCKTITS